MNNEIDARGKNCPIPVMMAKGETDRNVLSFCILVDNVTAVENLKRFGENAGYRITVTDRDADHIVSFLKTETHSSIQNSDHPKKRSGSWAIFAGGEGMGEGEIELGASLIKMFFYTLAEDDDIPCYILFMNSGVKVPVYNEQAIKQLCILEEKGSKILVCGTCLNYYNIGEDLKIGTVSNMYDITEALKSVDKVITL